MSSLSVRARTPFDIMSTNLSDLIALPDPEAASAMNERMAVFEQIERIHERSYAERIIIVREFERRGLWKYLADPDAGVAFPNFTAWMSCSDFLGCRRVNFEALRDGRMLHDVPADKLIDIPKSSIKVLTQLSTAVRNDPDILEAARNLPQDGFMEKVEREQPAQHLEVRKPLRFSPGRSGAKIIEQWIRYAMEHDIAGSRDEAIVRACEIAIHDAELDEELREMPAEDSASTVQ